MSFAALLTMLLAGTALAAPARADDFSWHNFVQVWWDFDKVYADLLTIDDQGNQFFHEGGSDWENQRILLRKVGTDIDAVLMPGDWDGDGYADWIHRNRDGGLHLRGGHINRSGGANGGLYKGQIGQGWDVMTALTSPGDWDGDGNPDVLARDSTGALWMYNGDGEGGWLPGPVQVGFEWNVMTAIFSGHDFNSDGPSDVIARDTGGQLWLYPGNGSGGWMNRVQIGWGWQGMDLITAPGDYDYDGYGDVIARDDSGTMWLYPGNGSGGFTGERRALNIPIPQIFG
jgi:hypothetical protein